MLEMSLHLMLVQTCYHFLSIVETFHAVAMQCIAIISVIITNAVIVSPSFYCMDRMATVLNGGYVIACCLWLYLLMTSQTMQEITDHKTCKYNYIYTIETIQQTTINVAVIAIYY